MDCELLSVNKSTISFEEIDKLVKLGMARYTFDVGSLIKFKLKDGRDVDARVVDFDVYKEHEVIFVMEDCYCLGKMVSDPVRFGGEITYEHQNIYESLSGQVINNLPDDLNSVIKTREIVRRTENEDRIVTSKLWIPSILEVAGDSISNRATIMFGYQEKTPNRQFEWFKDQKHRKKVLRTQNACVAVDWWTRSVLDNRFYAIKSGGSASIQPAASNCGIVFGFCI